MFFKSRVFRSDGMDMLPTHEIQNPAEAAAAKAAEPIVEAPHPAKPAVEAPKEDDDFAARMAHVSKREAKLVEKQRALAEAEKTHKQFASLKERVAAGDMQAAMEVLGLLGTDYDRLTSHVINGVDPEKAKFDSLEQKIEALKKESLEKDQRAKEESEARAIASFKGRIADAIEKNKDEYELIAMHGEEGNALVYDVVHTNWTKTGKLMPLQEAFTKVEAYLLDEYNKSVSKFKVAKKLASHFAPPVEQRETPASSVSAKREPPVTLSGQSGAASGSTAGPQTAAELRNAAIKVLGG
jgi:HPt (histidine-containing phosphotransfer) domain-containing protein